MYSGTKKKAKASTIMPIIHFSQPRWRRIVASIVMSKVPDLKFRTYSSAVVHPK
jgi:hypothetical protein